MRTKRSTDSHFGKPYSWLPALLIFCFILTGTASAQIFGHVPKGEDLGEPVYAQKYLKKLHWRNIGPFRGGRSVAVSGSSQQPMVAYMGGTGGGIFKTEDGGKSWINVSDGYFKAGSVGAVAVAPSDPNVVYVGMGETEIRGNMSPGDGMYKSTDGGKTWEHIGLGDTQFIGEIVVDPHNPDVVYVAALGHTFGNVSNEHRGVYKSTDGGATWNKVLYRNGHAGAVDIEIDPNNPRVLYATFWEAYRNPWEMSSGGPGSGLFKSTDYGKTWDEITKNPGLPKGINGKIGVAVSPVKDGRVWAIIENKNGGLFRSDDHGATWKLVNKKRKLRQRAWYYTHVIADTKDPNTVYVLNVRFHKSVDGGKSFESISTPHGDHHDLWVDPANAKHLIVGDDGGAQITYDGGKSWSSYNKYATAQFYHVIVDNRFPYRVYGAQQDNSTVRIDNRSAGYGIDTDNWTSVGGGESGYIAPDPEDEDVVYAGSYGGNLSRFNTETSQRWQIDVWPDNPMGHAAKDLKYRFQWTYPIYVSPNNPDALYATSQYVHRSYNQGQSWEKISPDLTRNEKSKQGKSGGPITKDDTSIEYYNTIFTFAESPVKAGILWAGSDDGLVHISMDNGKNWKDVTPKGLPESMISLIAPSPHEAGTAYMAVNRYKFDDFKPYLYKTDDYGEHWTKITKGIPSTEFTRAIREDPNKKGLLYAGTETGIYVSFNDGKQWQPLQLNLPRVPITDIAVQKRDKDLVVATQGRAFWIMDDLPVLYQLSDEVTRKDAHLYKPGDTYLFGRGSFSRPGATIGENPPDGVVVYYNLQKDMDSEVQLQFVENDGDVIRTYSNQKDEEGEPVKDNTEYYEKDDQHGNDVLTADEGLNRFVWDMYYPDVTEIHPQVLWGGNTRGPRAIPGTYKVRLIVDGKTVQEQEFKILKDPRIPTTQDDFEAQFALIRKIKDKLDETHKAINRIRKVRKQINSMLERQEDNEKAQEVAKPLLDKLAEIEQELVQVKSESPQDPLNYPIKLNNKLAALAGNVAVGDHHPTDQQNEVYEDLKKKVDVQLERLDQVMKGDAQNVMNEIYVKPTVIEN